MSGRLKREATHKIWKLKNSRQITESIGPEEGFILQYTLARRSGLTQTSNGLVMQQRVELVRFVMLATGSRIGEPIDEALRPNSAFHQRMGTLDPQSTTITVWTYPESFAEFRRVKEYLRELGFLAAARPLPHGHPIGGSPQGSRSMAQ